MIHTVMARLCITQVRRTNKRAVFSCIEHTGYINQKTINIITIVFTIKLLIILRYSYLLDDCNYFVVTCSAVDKVLNAYYVKLLAPPTIIHPLYSKKNKNGTVH